MSLGSEFTPSITVISVVLGTLSKVYILECLFFSLLKQSTAYLLLTIGLEFVPHHILNFSGIRAWWNHLLSCRPDVSRNYLQPLLGSSKDTSNPLADEDVDVMAERHRVMSGYADNAIIYLRNLWKVFIDQLVSPTLSDSMES